MTRALVRNSQILILDEATSSLDNKSEALINNKLVELAKTNNFTIINIAHRFSTIKHADNIFLISDGKAKELGKWEMQNQSWIIINNSVFK